MPPIVAKELIAADNKVMPIVFGIKFLVAFVIFIFVNLTILFKFKYLFNNCKYSIYNCLKLEKISSMIITTLEIIIRKLG